MIGPRAEMKIDMKIQFEFPPGICGVVELRQKTMDRFFLRMSKVTIGEFLKPISKSTDYPTDYPSIIFFLARNQVGSLKLVVFNESRFNEVRLKANHSYFQVVPLRSWMGEVVRVTGLGAPRAAGNTNGITPPETDDSQGSTDEEVEGEERMEAEAPSAASAASAASAREPAPALANSDQAPSVPRTEMQGKVAKIETPQAIISDQAPVPGPESVVQNPDASLSVTTPTQPPPTPMQPPIAPEVRANNSPVLRDLTNILAGTRRMEEEEEVQHTQSMDHL
jgi:hypothetical protein